MSGETQKIGIVLIEDDVPVRHLIKSYLLAYSQVEVLGETSDAEEALECIGLAKPGAVFLDIELPQDSGLLLAARLKEKYPGLGIVFVTGHPTYALEAFQLDALDYLVKPVTQDAVGRALRKIERFLGNKNGHYEPSLINRIAVKFKHEITIIDMEDIFFIVKEGRYNLFHTSCGVFQSSETLGILHKRLNKNFFRCHRSFIVNINKIQHIAPFADRMYEVSFYNYPLRVNMGRDKYEELCRIILNDDK